MQSPRTDSRIRRRAIEPRNIIAVSPRSGQTRGPRQATNSWSTQPAWSRRGRRTWRMITRVPWELGRPCRLHRRVPAGARLTNSRMIHSTVPSCGDEPGTKRWYRQAKATKCGEMDGRESERLVVLLTQGNQPEGPWQGKGTPSHEPAEGNTPGTLRPVTCQR